MSGAWIWLAVPALPLLSLLLLRQRRLRRWLWVAAVPAILLAFIPPPVLTLPIWWHGAELGGSDLVTRAWLAMTGVLWSAAGAFAAQSMRQGHRQSRFWVFWQLSLCGNLLLIVAQDAMSFYLGFSLMSLSAYGLIVHNRGPLPRKAGRLYLQLAILGEMLLFAGLVLHVSAAAGDISFQQLQQTPLTHLTILLLLLGFGIKAGFWPLHVWLPLAHPAAPAPASAVLSGAMIKAGVLGVWRFLTEASGPSGGDPSGGGSILQEWGIALLVLGCISAFYGVAVGLTRTHAKSVLAYSSVSQMGYLLVIIGLSWRWPEHTPALTVLLVLFVVHHGIAKASLFLAAGLASTARLHRFFWALAVLPALALAGMPGTSGGAVKDELKYLIKDMYIAGGTLLLTLGSCATALLLLRALWLMLRAQSKVRKTTVAPGMILPWVLLSISPLVVPLLWPLMREPWLHGLSLSSIWSGVWPIAVAAALAWLVVNRRWRLPRLLVSLPNPGLILSLRFKRVQQSPPLANMTPSIKQHRWRRRERHWNRFWHADVVEGSCWLLCLLLLLGWLW